MSRRRVLGLLGAAGFGCCLGRAATPSVATDASLVESVRDVTSDDMFDWLEVVVRRGAVPGQVLDAIFLAGVQEIRPRPMGSQLHAVMMIPSALQLIRDASVPDTWRAVAFALADLKRSQQRDFAQGDWRLPPRPTSIRTGEPGQRFNAAMQAWDDVEADRAIVKLCAVWPSDKVMQLVWPFAARCFVGLGHKIIYAAQIERMLPRLDADASVAALRSLVHGLLHRDPEPDLETYHRSLELASSIAEMPLEGQADRSQAQALISQLHEGGADFQLAVADALRNAVSAESVWLALRVVASDLFQARSEAGTYRHLPVHTITEVNAFCHAFNNSRDPRTRRLTLLQAAGWLPQLRQAVEDQSGPLSGDLGQLRRIESDSKVRPSLKSVFGEPDPRTAAKFLTRQGQEPYLKQMRRFLFLNATQDHQYKYLAALHEEARQVPPVWAPSILAPAVRYMPGESWPRREHNRQADAMLQRLGMT